MSSNIQVKNFIKLRTIFKEKGWDNFTGEDQVFASFVQLLNNLNDIEQELLLELTNEYLWIENGQYVPLLRDVLNEKECCNDLGTFNNVYFFPVIKPKDQNKTKSGNLLIYQIQPVKKMLKEPLKSRNISIFENFDDIAEDNFKLGKDDVFVLIDDFLGTGKTVDTTIKKVQENLTITSDKIRVISFTALKMSIDLLDALGIKSYIIHVKSKGISDVYGTLAPDKLNLMKKIERMSMADRSYKLGFKKSEALVTMARTPNNTFSIFWSNHIKGEEEFDAPFPRY